MSKEIDKDAIKSQSLSWADWHYAYDRGMIKESEYPEPEAPKADDTEELPAPTKYVPLEDQDSPTIEDKGGIVEGDEEEPYTVGWNNDQRRAELSKRSLSVTGGKDELIARLRRADAGASLPEDAETV